MNETFTREEILAAFDAAGLSVTDWAKAHNFRRQDVYALLSGRTTGRRGEAHRIAIALGLKPGVTGDTEKLLNRLTDNRQMRKDSSAP